MKSHYKDAFQLSSAKRLVLAVLILCAFAAPAVAKTASSRTDALGAHVNSGRGCPACHTPHSGTCEEHSTLTSRANPAGEMLWGQDVTSVYAAYGSPLSQESATNASYSGGVLRCLTCHDGNSGPRAMMRNVVYETIPSKYASLGTIPTLMDQESLISGHELVDHPIGLEAQINCGGRLAGIARNPTVLSLWEEFTRRGSWQIMATSFNRAVMATHQSSYAPRATIHT